jgi:hypothetical protein
MHIRAPQILGSFFETAYAYLMKLQRRSGRLNTLWDKGAR